MSLASIIDAAWEKRAEINASTKGEVRDAVNEALSALDSGTMRVAER
ncbi:MAG: 2,3,4,5-tetrahydropyridine-2,6-dicarboxylate N-succinyltransferase, partial [Rhabdaerophilum sp.]